MYNEIDDLFPENKEKIEKRKSLISELNALEEEYERTSKKQDIEETKSDTFLPSSFLDSRKKGKKKKENPNVDDWMDLMENLKMEGTKKKKQKDVMFLLGIDEDKKGKKKKKKGKHEDEVDYSSEFQPEIALYNNLLQEQSRFVDSLQKEYDALRSSKSSSRGMTKNMSDLVERITDARTLNMQLIKEKVNTKKTIADLTIKQKKELNTGIGEGENLGDFASSYLKSMIDTKNNYLNGDASDEISDYNEDDDYYDEYLDEQLSDTDRSSDIDTQLKYEKSNVKVYVQITNDDIENYEFVAIDEDGNEITDYPVPPKSSISVNRSINVATDTYGRKFNIIWK